jgi:hypothetical protein
MMRRVVKTIRYNEMSNAGASIDTMITAAAETLITAINTMIDGLGIMRYDKVIRGLVYDTSYISSGAYKGFITISTIRTYTNSINSIKSMQISLKLLSL